MKWNDFSTVGTSKERKVCHFERQVSYPKRKGLHSAVSSGTNHQNHWINKKKQIEDNTKLAQVWKNQMQWKEGGKIRLLFSEISNGKNNTAQ